MANLDLFTLASAVLIFVLFLVGHIVTLRIQTQTPASQILTQWFFAGFGGWVLIWTAGIFYPGFVRSAFSRVWVPAMAASAVLYVLLVFHYLVWVFGMGEAAIRIRLLREFERYDSRRATLADIHRHYNAEIILRSRLDRLVNSGHLQFDGKFYTIRRRILLVQSRITHFLRTWVGVERR